MYHLTQMNLKRNLIMFKDISHIKGLKWEKRWRANNGGESTWVIPFPTTKPANIVFHSSKHFDYGQYGIHIGQEDRLTFLGNSTLQIFASFIDCRKNSDTFGERFSLHFFPSSEKTLIIPPGVAHSFNGLENIFTINSYEIFLPNPEELYNNSHDWNLTSDILNIPIDIHNSDLPKIIPNKMLSSNRFYNILRDQQIENISKINYLHPVSYRFKENGILKKITIKEKIKQIDNSLETWEPINNIFGIGWMKHFNIITGDESGIVPLLDESPFYIVDHGEIHYSHDSYGIHLGQEDRLTFLGNKDQLVELALVDCREGSPTLHNKVIIHFNPSPLKYLIIPPGVAHAFKNLENVYTINRARILLDGKREYFPRNDIIDWPLNNEEYPVLKTNKIVADSAYYSIQAMEQENFINTNHSYYETPVSHLYQDIITGKKYKITIKNKKENSIERT
jgi:dTDP-4-dehydrorhamnose 3,5-epimerase-like enzyme